MELTKTLGTAFLYLRSFWHNEATVASEITVGARNLSEDVIVEILAKLPVKSLLRFRCVCKSWFHLIKSPNFVKMHLNYHKNNNDNILILSELETRPKRVISIHSYQSLGVISPNLEIPYFDSDEKVRICGSCDGLICLSNGRGDPIVLSNPTMGEFKILPPYPFSCPEGGECLTGALGFGFDSMSNDYKVIAIVMLIDTVNSKCVQKAVVFNLNAESWREIDCGLRTCSIECNYSGTLFDGTIHWNDGNQREIIHCFDMSTEVFSEMKLPNIDPKEGNYKHLMVLNGSFAMCMYGNPLESQVFNVWVMEKYGVTESWTKQLTFGPVTGLIRGFFHPLFVWNNEAIIVKHLLSHLHSISLGARKMKSFNIRGNQGSVEEVVVCQESLVSINGGDAKSLSC